MQAKCMQVFFFFRMISAPHQKFATYSEGRTKHKPQVRIYSIPRRLYHDWKQVFE